MKINKDIVESILMGVMMGVVIFLNIDALFFKPFEMDKWGAYSNYIFKGLFLLLAVFIFNEKRRIDKLEEKQRKILNGMVKK